MAAVYASYILLFCFVHIWAADVEPDYELTIKEDAINELIGYFSYDINQQIVGSKVSGMSQDGITTSDSKIQNFSYSELITRFDGVNKSVYMEMSDVNGSIATIDIVLTQNVVLTTIKCKGEANPVFRNWGFAFFATIFINNTCDLALSIAESSVVVTEGDLDLNEFWYDSTCDTLIDALDAVFNLKQRLINDLVRDLPGMIVNMLQGELAKLLPSTQAITVAGFEGADLIVCYREVEFNQLQSALTLGVDFKVDNSSLSDADIDRSAFDARVQISNSNLAEIWIVFAFGVLASLVGCGCMLAICVMTGKATLRKPENEKNEADVYRNNVSISPSAGIGEETIR